MPHHDLSLGYLSLPGATPQQVVAAAGAAGLQQAGLRIGPRTASEPGDWPVNDARLLRELADQASGCGVHILNVVAQYVTPQTTAASFDALFDAAQQLGARFVCLSSYDPQPQRLGDTLGRLAEAAAARSLQLALEFVPYSETRTLAAAQQAIAHSGAPNAGVLLDVLHFMRSGGDVAGLQALSAGQLAFVQLCDGAAQAPRPEDLSAEARTGRLYPGEGAFPLRQILAALPAAVPMEIEIPHASLRDAPFEQQAIRAAVACRAWLAGDIHA